jgi:hypothetical protein
MPPPRWFAVGSADGAEPDAGVRTAIAALMYDGAKLPMVFRSQSYGADYAERWLSCIAQVPQDGLMWIMERDADSVPAATDGACRDSLAALDGRPPLGVLAFDCIARRGVLGDRGIHTEIQRLAAITGQAPVAGFYTYGEIARTRGMRGFHNQTLVVLSIS